MRRSSDKLRAGSKLLLTRREDERAFWIASPHTERSIAEERD
jgi:hypothetical protein